jgi:hypothetical protein
MFMRLNIRAFPAFLVVLSTLWMAATICPLLYSLMFPTKDILRIVRMLRCVNDAPPKETRIPILP